MWLSRVFLKLCSLEHHGKLRYYVTLGIPGHTSVLLSQIYSQHIQGSGTFRSRAIILTFTNLSVSRQRKKARVQLSWLPWG